jgi:hypothetical protein
MTIDKQVMMICEEIYAAVGELRERGANAFMPHVLELSLARPVGSRVRFVLNPVSFKNFNPNNQKENTK